MSNTKTPDSFTVEGFVISIRPPTEHRLLTTLDVSHLSPSDYFAFLKVFKDRKRPIDELWKERDLRGTSIHASHQRLFGEPESEESKTGKWKNTIRPSLFPSRFVNELKGIRSSILDFLNNPRYCIAVEEAPSAVFSEAGSFESQRKLYVIPFTKLSEMNRRRKEWNERLQTLNKKIKSYLEGRRPDGQQEQNNSYEELLNVLNIYGIKFVTAKPQSGDELLPSIIYKFSSHTISSSPGLKERALAIYKDKENEDELEEIEAMLSESDNIALVNTLRKFHQEAISSVREVVEKWERISQTAKGRDRTATEKEEKLAKKASLSRLEEIKKVARDLGMRSLEDTLTPVINYIEKTRPSEVQVALIEQQLTGRIKGLRF